MNKGSYKLEDLETGRLCGEYSVTVPSHLLGRDEIWVWDEHDVCPVAESFMGQTMLRSFINCTNDKFLPNSTVIYLNRQYKFPDDGLLPQVPSMQASVLNEKDIERNKSFQDNSHQPQVVR